MYMRGGELTIKDSGLIGNSAVGCCTKNQSIHPKAHPCGHHLTYQLPTPLVIVRGGTTHHCDAWLVVVREYLTSDHLPRT